MAKELKKRAEKDEHEILWEELEDQLAAIKKLYKSGDLSLNSVVLEKSALYLRIDTYIKNVKDKRMTEDEKLRLYRERKRNKRKFKRERIEHEDHLKLSASNFKLLGSSSSGKVNPHIYIENEQSKEFGLEENNEYIINVTDMPRKSRSD